MMPLILLSSRAEHRRACVAELLAIVSWLKRALRVQQVRLLLLFIQVIMGQNAICTTSKQQGSLPRQCPYVPHHSTSGLWKQVARRTDKTRIKEDTLLLTSVRFTEGLLELLRLSCVHDKGNVVKLHITAI